MLGVTGEEGNLLWSLSSSSLSALLLPSRRTLVASCPTRFSFDRTEPNRTERNTYCAAKLDAEDREAEMAVLRETAAAQHAENSVLDAELPQLRGTLRLLFF